MERFDELPDGVSGGAAWKKRSNKGRINIFRDFSKSDSEPDEDFVASNPNKLDLREKQSYVSEYALYDRYHGMISENEAVKFLFKYGIIGERTSKRNTISFSKIAFAKFVEYKRELDRKTIQ